MSQKTCSVKKIGKSDVIKIENFLICNDSIKRIKRQATDQDKIFAHHISGGRIVSRIYEKFTKLNHKKTTQ